MARGDIVIVAAPGDYGKPRPAVIVQTDAFPENHASVVVCQLTSDLVDAPDGDRSRGGRIGHGASIGGERYPGPAQAIGDNGELRELFEANGHAPLWHAALVLANRVLANSTVETSS